MRSLLAVPLLLACAGFCRAEMINQIPDPFVPVAYPVPPGNTDTAFSVYDNSGLFGVNQLQSIYDNFTFQHPPEFNCFRVSWVGKYENSDVPLPGTTFEIRLYEDDNGMPPTPVGTPTPLASVNVGTASETATGVGSFYNYSGLITANLVANTQYWISIVANMDLSSTQARGWGVAFSDTNGDGLSFQDVPTSPVSYVRFGDEIDYAFSISAVPEPGSWAVMAGVGLFAAIGVRRKRRQLSAVAV